MCDACTLAWCATPLSMNGHLAPVSKAAAYAPSPLHGYEVEVIGGDRRCAVAASSASTCPDGRRLELVRRRTDTSVTWGA